MDLAHIREADQSDGTDKLQTEPANIKTAATISSLPLNHVPPSINREGNGADKR